MRLAIVGTGYVGLVTGSCFADSGNTVTCLDTDRKKIEQLKRGESPIYEPGLMDLLKKNTKLQRLHFTTEADAALKTAQVIFVCVGTPTTPSGELSLEFVKSALQTIADKVSNEAIVVMKSTVPMGTAEMAREILSQSSQKIHVVSNPEFLREGCAIEDFMRPERVVVGYQNEYARQMMSELYAPFVRTKNPILYMDNASAELAKYTANSFLAMKISFINKVAELCEKTGANVRDVRAAITTDSRIGRRFLHPGCGYGGSCFPKDVRAMLTLGEKHDVNFDLFQNVDEINQNQKLWHYHKLKAHFGSALSSSVIALWGLAFKPETDDMREAPAISLIEKLLEEGATVRVYDPVAMQVTQGIFGDRISYVEDRYDVLKGSDALCVMTEWNEFRQPQFNVISESLRQPLVFDGRNVWDPNVVKKTSLKYVSVGTPGVNYESSSV